MCPMFTRQVSIHSLEWRSDRLNPELRYIEQEFIGYGKLGVYVNYLLRKAYRSNSQYKGKLHCRKMLSKTV